MIDPSASDWSDLDLLTNEEADERLRDEIGVMEAEIAQRRDALDDPDGAPDAGLALAQRRLAALRKRRDTIARP